MSKEVVWLPEKLFQRYRSLGLSQFLGSQEVRDCLYLIVNKYEHKCQRSNKIILNVAVIYVAILGQCRQN
jgi:hypothetical protein